MPRTKTKSANTTETQTQREARAKRIVEILHHHYGNAECELTFKNPFQLLVATILSAQCTDVRVNKVTPELFKKFPTSESITKSKPGEIEEIIKSTGFYNNKAKNIRGAAGIIVSKFNGEVPRTMDELLQLPGVARKTGNVVLSSAFGLTEGFVVDTHIQRLSRRLGFTKADAPEKIEVDLCNLFPKTEWNFLSHAIIWHGRRICSARTPNCEHCPIAELCPSKNLAPDSWKKR
ncbi:MAG: endonuclease III [Planctomycetota bacterium]